MRKLKAVTLVVGLFCFGQQAIAGPQGHAARPHVVTITVQGPPTHENVEHLDQLMSGLSKIPTRAAEAKEEHSPGEFAAKAAPIVEQSPRYQNAHAQNAQNTQNTQNAQNAQNAHNAHAPSPNLPQAATETAQELQSKALAAESALKSKEANLQAEAESVSK